MDLIDYKLERSELGVPFYSIIFEGKRTSLKDVRDILADRGLQRRYSALMHRVTSGRPLDMSASARFCRDVNNSPVVGWHEPDEIRLACKDSKGRPMSKGAYQRRCLEDAIFEYEPIAVRQQKSSGKRRKKTMGKKPCTYMDEFNSKLQDFYLGRLATHG